jgi:hypothetical protein
MRRYHDQPDPGTLLAAFGEARLMNHLDGRLDLVGGTEADRQAALEWLARFLPEARLGQPKPMPWPRRG